MPPISLLIKPVSGICNLRCKYCFYRDVSAHRESESYGRMTLDTLERLVRKSLDYADGSVTFAVQGGEPTLAGLEFYKHLISLQRKYNTKGVYIQNTIQTNGMLLSEDWASFFAEHHF